MVRIEKMNFRFVSMHTTAQLADWKKEQFANDTKGKAAEERLKIVALQPSFDTRGPSNITDDARSPYNTIHKVRVEASSKHKSHTLGLWQNRK